MLRHNLMTAGALVALAAAKDTGSVPAPIPAGNTPVPPAAPAAKVPTTVLGVTMSVPLPEKPVARGGKSLYKFDDLTAPTRDDAGKVIAAASFGVKGKTAESLRAVISTANRKGVVEKRDAAGALVYKQAPVKDAAGQIVAYSATKDVETEVVKHFFAVNVDPKADPEGASCRVFRDV